MKTPEEICPDFNDWPVRWHEVAEDVPYGRGLLDAMRLFVVHLIDSGLKDKTIRNHMDYLWLLGGEVIRSVSLNEDYNIPPAEKLRRSVDKEGGIYCRHLGSELEEVSYQATARKLHKFLQAQDARGSGCD
jgi:hypothetical protein